MNSGLKSGFVLLVIGVVCGALLALVNSMTAPIIADIELQEKYAALESFYDLDDYDLTVIEDVDENVLAIFKLEQNDTLVALVYQVAATGYNGDVVMLIAVNSNYSVEGYKVISHSEDAGFGADIVENDFNVTSITNLSFFDAVAGATYTSNAILECFTIVSERAGTDFGGGLDD